MKKQYVYSPGLGKMVEVDIPASSTQPSARRRRLERAYAQVPLKEAAAAFKATRAQKAFVWVWLRYLAWQKKSATFPLPNGELEQYGIRRDTKWRALRDYERARLISIEQVGRNSTIVTLSIFDRRQ